MGIPFIKYLHTGHLIATIKLCCLKLILTVKQTLFLYVSEDNGQQQNRELGERRNVLEHIYLLYYYSYHSSHTSSMWWTPPFNALHKRKMRCMLVATEMNLFKKPKMLTQRRQLKSVECCLQLLVICS